MTKPELYPRQIEPLLREALADSPVVLVHGPRQSGKSTLAKMTGKPLGYEYLSFDDDTIRAAADADPIGFVEGLSDRVILDEIQRVPELFTTIKHAVDARSGPGRFLLTGSANVLLLPRLADSLAGRMEVLRLHPLAQCELERQPGQFVDALFADRFKVRYQNQPMAQLVGKITAGGYPAALRRSTGRRRQSWYRNYINALVQRDVQDLGRIHSLEAMPRLLELAASQTAQLFNASRLAAPFQLSRPTISSYMTLLENVFLLERLQPWHSNRVKRLIKTPKLHLGDTGLACALLGVDADDLMADRALLGHVLESFVYQELRRQDSWAEQPARFYHFRDRDGMEVDIVIERSASALAGVEIKAAASVDKRDFRALEKLRNSVGERFRGGVVLYCGERTLSFGDRLTAVPVSALWGSGDEAAEQALGN